MKKLLVVLITMLSISVNAAGWTNTALVEHIEVIRNDGFQINGVFGNPSECTTSDSVFVSITHPQYDQLLSVAMAAFMSGKKLKIYSHQCINYGWHGGTYNELASTGSMYLKN